jgi:phosphoglycolate phosphatase-like HAD superfamily hydrolase
MPAPYSILTLDLHNTIYDETMEYGPAIEAAIAVWTEAAEKHGTKLTQKVLFDELAAGHRKLASDWDGEVWRFLPSLARLGLEEAEFQAIMAEAENRRNEASRQLTLKGYYAGAHETLSALKARGVRIYVVTEAAADAGMKAIAWLKLGGVVDGIYSYPSRSMPTSSAVTRHKPFPDAASGGFLRKPHPFILASVVLDESIRRGEIPPGVQLGDVFAVSQDASLRLRELPDDAPVQQDVCARLALKPTPHAAALRRMMDKMLYIGDSKFKDGLLARNAGVAFGYAAYGKKIKPEDAAKHPHNLEVMYATTGWDRQVMKLTQEAGKSSSVASLRPEFTFEDSLDEALGLFAAQS